MSAFPTDLPYPSIESYSAAPDKAFIRTDMDSGPARQRQRFTASPTMVGVSWKFTAAQMITFRTFFNSTIGHGADWFTMTLDIGDGLLAYDTRFVEPWTANMIPVNVWSISAKLEVRAA